jgi:insertion element IS1 protein InsB
VGVGRQWLLPFMMERFPEAPEQLSVTQSGGTPAVILQRLEAELDELWSYGGKTANRHGVWIALEATPRQVRAFHVGDRSGQSAQALWEKMPAVYQEHALFSTDHSAADTGGIPSAQHRAISKRARKTNPVERFNGTLRPRVARLVRATLSFSKELSTHIGAIKYFIGDYNLTRSAALPG